MAKDEESDIMLEEIEETIIKVEIVSEGELVSLFFLQEKVDGLLGARPRENYDIQYMCNDCNLVFMTMEQLESHQSGHHRKTVTTVKFQCNFCNRMFLSVEVYN